MTRSGTPARWLALWLLLATGGCGSSHPREGDTDGGSSRDGGGAIDAGRADGGRLDGGRHDGGDTGGWSACTANPQCVVAPASCCGRCGAAVPGDMVGVNEARLSAQRTEACVGDGACPACFAAQDPFLIATCELGSCLAMDLRTHDATRCVSDSDCFLAAPECCTCGVYGIGTAIAISDRSALRQLTCDPTVDCPPCEATFDGTVAAACGDDGHCTTEAR